MESNNMTREEAINKVRQMSLPKETMDILEELVPELAMSEDERMINELQGFLLSFGSDYFGTGEWQKFDNWLEKQKEQKPKFYPGDVIKCTSTGSLWVRCKDGDNIRSDGHTACIGGGYELASKEEAVQFFQELNENGYQWDCIKGRPMKKEQKPEQYDIDVLEKHITKDSISELAHTVIVRNGWEIVEAEQKPAKWSEEDERILNGIIGLIDHDQHYGVSNNEMISWLKTLRPQPRAKTNDYITPHKKFFQWIYNRLIDVHGENPNVDYMQSFKKRIDNLQFSESQWKPSKDEVRLINTSISFLKDFADKGYENAVECIDWLKSKLNGNTCK